MAGNFFHGKEPFVRHDFFRRSRQSFSCDKRPAYPPGAPIRNSAQRPSRLPLSEGVGQKFAIRANIAYSIEIFILLWQATNNHT
jgi:hypothetical protein